jgi:hypothetical protein
MLPMSQLETSPLYRIEVRGWLDPDWSDWLADLAIHTGRDAAGLPITVIHGPVADQAALQGILTRLWSLNLPVLGVACVSGYGRPAAPAELPAAPGDARCPA